MRISVCSSDVCSSDLPGLPIYISGLGSKREITDVVVRDQRYTIAFLVVVGKALRVVIIGEQLANLKAGLPNGSSERLDTYVGPDPRAIFNEMLCLASLFIFIMLLDERGSQFFQRFPSRHTQTSIARTPGLGGISHPFPHL